MIEGMDIELTKKWLADLESGKLKQVEAALVSNNGQSFCCLGVLCKTAGKKVRKITKELYTSGKEVEKINLAGFYFGGRGGPKTGTFDTSMPDEETLNKVGLSNGDGLGIVSANYLRAAEYAEMNDSGKSFADIAKQLREDYAAKGIDLTA
jgi:hypothetical protein